MSKKFGWVDLPQEVERFVATLPTPIFALSARAIRDTGKGKVVLLWSALDKVLGQPFPVHNQTIGDCVSHGYGLGVDVLKAVQIVTLSKREEFKAETCTEAIYALSRVEIGGGRIGNEDGSLGAWAVDALKRYGVLARGQYGNFDVRKYSGKRAKEWGAPRAGLPDELEPIAKDHPIRTVSMVRSYEEARDAIANGYPVIVCSMVGFEGQQNRDADGFLRARGQWPHCMAFIGLDDSYKRPGLLCENSWGTDWVRGPKRHEQPEGSFWVDADTCTRMLREGDSFAISGFEGYPAQDIPEYWVF